MVVRSLRVAEWNANGLPNHKLELMQFLQDNNTIDVLLVSETHFTDQTVLKIPNYSIYPTSLSKEDRSIWKATKQFKRPIPHFFFYFVLPCIIVK